MNKRGKKGALEISFGMIFSIILIIIIELQNTVQIEKFSSDFQEDVNTMWKSTGGGSQNLEYFLPAKIISVCFSNDEFQNLQFISDEIIPGENIENIDIAKITQEENPYCIQNTKGKVSLTIIKDYGETLVTVKRQNET
jgi:hypothetical protein